VLWDLPRVGFAASALCSPLYQDPMMITIAPWPSACQTDQLWSTPAPSCSIASLSEMSMHLEMYLKTMCGSPSMNFLPCKTAKKNGDFYAKSDSFNLKIPSDKAKVLADYVGKSVILGIRPEDIIIRSQAKEHDPETVFTGSVWVTEPLGSEKLVYIKNGQHTIVTRQDPHIEVKTGETVDLVANMALSHVFDEETEKTVY